MTLSSSQTNLTNNLRTSLRTQRLALSESSQALNAKQATVNFIAQDWVFNKIGVFLTDDGELDTKMLIQHLWQENKQVFLPLVGLERSLSFAEYYSDTELVENKFGILEPYKTEVVKPQDLDLVLVPLVGFDAWGNRLGRGGGFYDKSFASKENRPLLVGWAHSCQQVEKLNTNSWDVPLDAVVTEKQVFVFS